MKNTEYAYAGRILRVDLTRGRITTVPTARYARRFLGGRGINEWLLYQEARGVAQPFAPESPLLFGAGVLVGTAAPTASRCSVEGMNVLTGGIGSANGGGHFASELKYAGYDHVVVRGHSRRPCYLWINDSSVAIKAADHLWGKTTWETEEILRDDLGDADVQCATIGPAGERRVRAANVLFNRARSASRCGLGAVMGAKRLKAIAVKGTGAITVAKPEVFLRLIQEYLAMIATDPVLRQMTEAGLACFRDGANQKGNNPYRNFQDMYWDPAKVALTSSRVLQDRYYVRNLSCFACPVACSHHIRLSDTEGEGIPSNAIGDWGCKLDVADLDAILTSYFLCNQYGLDSDNAAGVIAWLMECQQRGLLTPRDTDGLDLTWGNHHAVHALIRKIAYREGVGNLLAEGGVRAARKLGRGSEQYVLHIKGQELHEALRGRIGYALGVVTSPRGGGHLRGAMNCETGIEATDGVRLYGVATAGDRRAYQGKPELVIYFETLKAVVDALGLCYFATKWVSPTLPSEVELSALLSAATGYDVSSSDLMRIGERIRNVERLYNVRAGMTRRDDVPPSRFFQPIPSGPYQGERLQRNEWDAMLDRYYALSGWDPTGRPTPAHLNALGLDAERLGERERASGPATPAS